MASRMTLHRQLASWTAAPLGASTLRALVAAVAAGLASSEAAPAAEPAAGAARVSGGSVVRVSGDAHSGYRLLRNGEPFVIRGVGGTARPELLASCGGNCLRTWSAAAADERAGDRPLIDAAHEHGIAVTIGLWLGHERHGFDYRDPAQVARQREQVEAAVRRFKDHPALLAWGLGNEMEGPTGDGDGAAVWREVNVLAELVRAIDPNHPVMPVVANVNPAKLRAIREHAPDIDILGVNAYGDVAGVGARLRSAGWTKPYCITEYGLPGPWEVPLTAWNAPIEPSSRQKAAATFVAHADIMADSRQCLGAHAFLWGQKQEATASWFGMLLPGGEKTPRVDALTRAWTGSWPADRAPLLKEIEMPLENARVAAGITIAVRARYEDPEGAALSYAWEVVAESSDRRLGGDAERRPEPVAAAIVRAGDDGTAVVRTPATSGPYRLFVTVRDGAGSGCIDNWAFFVEP